MGSPDSLLIDRILIYKTGSNQNFIAKINIYVWWCIKILNNITFGLQTNTLLKYLFIIIPLLISCKNETQTTSLPDIPGDSLSVVYAKGFSIVQYEDFKILTVNDPWPGSSKSFNYLLYEEGATIPEGISYDHKIQIPVAKIVLTSTTFIPSLESLGEINSLVGFPGLDYISSSGARILIDENKITELGQNESINTEVLISLRPNVVIGFAVNNSNKTFNTIEKSGIPVLYNGDWTEETPLGKAEWIKYFGALFNKSDEAEKLFEEVASNYNEAKEIAATASDIPTVLSGSMYKDQWYVPYGNSWSALFIKDANADYIYKDTSGRGSRALAFETVLSEAGNADFWISPGQFKSFSQLNESSLHYNRFKAVQEKRVYTYSNTFGPTGGAIYYELAPNRPDLVLKDLISIFHPGLLPEHELFFFKPLE